MDWILNAPGYLLLFAIWIYGLRIIMRSEENLSQSKNEGDVDGVEKNTLRSVFGFALVFGVPFVGIFVFGYD